MNILLLADDDKSAAFIRKGLTEEGYRVEVAADAPSGEEMAAAGKWDLLILDSRFSASGDFGSCRRIRASRKDLPILILSGDGDTQHKVAGLDAGADDYLTKPFHFEELLARIHALTRLRASQEQIRHYKIADLEVDLYLRSVHRSGKAISLTATEFSLLKLLLAHEGQVLSRAFISETVWGIDFDRGTNVVTVYINYLRNKIDKGFETPLIYTVTNSGYMLKA